MLFRIGDLIIAQVIHAALSDRNDWPTSKNVQLITMFFLWMERLVLKVIALVKCLQAVLYRSNAKQCFGSGRPLGFVGCIQNVPHQHNLVLSFLS
jgi:hypothetical protein